MSKINIFTEGSIKLPYHGAERKFIRKAASEILTIKQTGDVIVNIILTDNETIAAINGSYRKKNYATDVISFANREEPFPAPSGSAEELGDVYISLEKALEQSSEFEVSFRDEMKRLLVHGILHLLGYDHERSKDDKKLMEAQEEMLFRSLEKI